MRYLLNILLIFNFESFVQFATVPINENIKNYCNPILTLGKGFLIGNNEISMINPTDDSCGIFIETWFAPLCHMDTCTNSSWDITYNEKCSITKVNYKIWNPEKSKVIYDSNKIWEGRADNALGYYKANYYPYEITFYAKEKKIIKNGIVYLHIW